MFYGGRMFGVLGVGLVILLGLSVVAQMDLPEPTGPHAVGRTARHWVDISRPEELTPAPQDRREVPVQIWYPAQKGTGVLAPYFPGLAPVSQSLAASGEVDPLAVFGLRFIRSHERLNAAVAGDGAAYPVLLLSPGNGTNAEFYAAIAGELASHGYVVVGLNHPFDVAAVVLGDGTAARFVGRPEGAAARQAWISGRIAVRTDDVLFALDQLSVLNAQADDLLFGRLDLSRPAAMGHSLGGIAAARACRAQARFRACLNLDGLQRGGPFSSDDSPEPPEQPFMLVTKEEQLHPALRALFEAIPAGSYRVVVRGASHDSFTDGPLLQPSLLPLPNRADRILALTRAYTLAFFEQTLRQQPGTLLGEPLQSEQVWLEVYAAHP